METITSVTAASSRRVALSFGTDMSQSTFFLTQAEFLRFMTQVFDYRDAHKEELQEVINNMERLTHKS